MSKTMRGQRCKPEFQERGHGPFLASASLPPLHQSAAFLPSQPTSVAVESLKAFIAPGPQFQRRHGTIS